MYNVIEYSDNYWRILGSLWQQYRDEPALTDGGAIANFCAAHSIASFEFKQKITRVAGDNGTKNVEIMVPLKLILINVCYLMILNQQHL